MKQKYSEETRNSVVERYTLGEPVKEISKQTLIPRSTIYGWLKLTSSEKTKNKEQPLAMQVYLLNNRINKLNSIVEVLKRVDCTVNDPLYVRLVEMEKIADQYSVHTLCDALNVSRGTFYNHMRRNKRDEAWYIKRRDEMREEIRRIYDDNRQIYGPKKVTAILKEQGYKVSERFVSSCMSEMGLFSVRNGAKFLYKKENTSFKNRVNRHFNVLRPNEVWVSDVTYYKRNGTVYYICVIIDLYARLVVGHRIGKRNSTQLTTRTFKSAYENRQPDKKLVFHTDRGANYKSNSFMRCLSAYGVEQSFSRAHNPFDNSVVESFFSSMKREELYRVKYRSEKEFRKAVDDYIEFYNCNRPHANNRYRTPKDKEQEYYARERKKGET